MTAGKLLVLALFIAVVGLACTAETAQESSEMFALRQRVEALEKDLTSLRAELGPSRDIQRPLRGPAIAEKDAMKGERDANKAERDAMKAERDANKAEWDASSPLDHEAAIERHITRDH